MRNGRLVSYRTIASTLQRDFPFLIETISDEEVIEWLGAFMGLTNSPMMLSDQIGYLELCDGKAQLPCDLHLIMQVAKTDASIFADGPCSSLSPMRWTTDKFHRRYHDNDSDYRSHSSYTYTVNDNYIFANINEGILAISYKAIPTDEEGFPMIPADEQWVQAAIHDIAWKSARKLWYSNKITTDRFQKLEQELRDMRGPQLREHIQNLSEAKDKGDLSENAEYDMAKTAIDDLNRKINNLSQRLANAEILEGIVDDGTVQLLTWVKFKNTKSGVEIEYRIVPENEIDIKSGKISHLSPIGSALMSKRVGDKVIAEVPIGKMELEILNIRVK